MATSSIEVPLEGIRDPQRIATFAVGALLIVVGAAGLSGVLDFSVLGENLLLGVFGVPLWLGITAIVAGLLGAMLARYGGGATTFNKVAAGLVLPAVFLLALVDWALATGGIGVLLLGAGAVVLAVVLVGVGVLLLWGHPLVVVLPVVALLAIADWGLGLTALTPGESVTLATLGLLLVLAIVVGVVGWEGGRRMTQS